MPRQLVLLIAMLLLTLSNLQGQQDQVQLSLQDGDVVAFFGGANMVHAVRSGELEYGLTSRFVSSDRSIRFRDLSWEADTVYRLGTVKERWRPDGFGQRNEQFQRVGMTVAILQFGQMESMDGVETLEEFESAYRELLNDLRSQARAIVLITPIAFEKPHNRTLPDLTTHNASLAEYVEVIQSLAKEFDAATVDLFHSELTEVTQNGLHVKAESLADVSNEILRQLGVKPAKQIQSALLTAIQEKQRLWYDYWRPANWKLLYGDDSRREFTRGGDDYIPFRDEWKKLIPLVGQAEERIFAIACGEPDPGHNRPAPEILHGDSRADIQAELDSFEVPEGFEVSLFASEEHGLTSPLNLRWDPSGRMYVTVTTTYPHVWPGDVPNDKVIVLEDTNRDGQADRSTVFAEGLNIPTGIEWGEGGIYVGQNTEILFLKDTDGDLKSDSRQVLLGGFGNGDSHQTINSFVWSPDGELYFGQGDGCESRVETPWGNSELYQAGFYRLRPRCLQLDPLLDDFMGPGNPWGVAFDSWGQIFCVDGAGGVTFLSPGQIPVHHRRRLGRIGDPGGYCGIGLLDGRHLPEEYQGDFVVGDFKQNRIKRFSLEDNGSGFKLNWEAPLLTSSHRNFRPVDVKVGPDGAVYIVDWYNPITCHQDDAYRHPDRDKAHGRIWRVSTRRETTTPVDLLKAPLDVVIEHLSSPEHTTRYLAKRALTVRDTQQVSRQLNKWVDQLDVSDIAYEQQLFEAVSVCATLELVNQPILEKLLVAVNPNARAFAARIAGRWNTRLDNPLQLLATAIDDSHPRVRLEAVIACAAVEAPESIAVAAGVMRWERDGWIDYAFRQAVQQLMPVWRPAFEQSEIQFSNANEMAAVLAEAGGNGLVDGLKRTFSSPDLDQNGRREVLTTILTVGGDQDIRQYALDADTFFLDNEYQAELHAEALRIVAGNARYRSVRPAGDWQPPLIALADSEVDAVKASALLLAGAWDVDACKTRIYQAAADEDAGDEIRIAAFHSLSLLENKQGREGLVELLTSGLKTNLRLELVKAVSELDLSVAVNHGMELLVDDDLNETQQQALLTSLLSQERGTEFVQERLQQVSMSEQQAKEMLANTLATGRANQTLLATLAMSLGVSTKPPEYSEALVKSLKRNAEQSGDATRGAEVFRAVACTSCHRIGGKGGTVGPNLTGLGRTLSGERIIEEVIWPNRQIKEGYTSLRVITQDGKVLQGFERKTKQSEAEGGLAMLDPQTQQIVILASDDIDEVHKSASVMPEGLTNLLTADQLNDLLAFLMQGRIDD